MTEERNWTNLNADGSVMAWEGMTDIVTILVEQRVNAGDADATVTLNTEELRRLFDWLLDGICPLCKKNEILVKDARVCSECLGAEIETDNAVGEMSDDWGRF